MFRPEWLRWNPRFELVWLGRTQFFPPPPTHELFESISEICIGTKTRTIGDALMVSTLPRKLKAKYPHLKIYSYPRAFNPVVFRGNPAVEGISRVPSQLYGDDCSSGHGHLIQLKEQYFGLDVSDPPRPEIYLSVGETERIRSFVESHRYSDRPLCIIHAWGHTWKSVGERDFWIQLIRKNRDRFRFWQVGLIDQSPLPGCEYYFFTSRQPDQARKLFALLSQADALIGVNSGPMHIARAFGVPSAIVTRQGDVAELLKRRREAPYYLRGNWAHAFLYEENTHLEADRMDTDQLLVKATHFLASL